jgi:hypothetical protein
MLPEDFPVRLWYPGVFAFAAGECPSLAPL